MTKTLEETTCPKIQYEKPRIEKIGEFAEITQHGTHGGFTDAFFGAGTLFSDITFS